MRRSLYAGSRNNVYNKMLRESTLYDFKNGFFLDLYRHFQISQWDHAKKHSISSFQDNVNQNHCQILLHTFLNVWNPKDWQHHLMIDTPHLKLSHTARRNRKSYNHHKKTAYCLIYIANAFSLLAWLMLSPPLPINLANIPSYVQGTTPMLSYCL